MKDEGNKRFKNAYYYQASKIYNSAYYRYSYGDVFGNDSKKLNDNLEITNPELLKDLLDL